jgi:hypothetical protein
MAEEKEDKIHYFKKTVAYLVGGRRDNTDAVGWVINDEHPWVEVKESEMRNFRLANKRAFTEGLIQEIPEPGVDWETTNAYSDEEIDALFKSGLTKLRKTLPQITAASTVGRMLERAKIQRRSEGMIDALEDRLAELQSDELDFEKVERILSA